MIIDPHAHIAPESFIEDVRQGRYGDAVTIEADDPWEQLVTKSTVLGEERIHKNPLPKETYDVEMRLSDMDDNQNVDIQILSVVPPMTHYALDAGLNRELSTSLNDALTGLTKATPRAFSLHGADSAPGRGSSGGRTRPRGEKRPSGLPDRLEHRGRRTWTTRRSTSSGPKRASMTCRSSFTRWTSWA